MKEAQGPLLRVVGVTVINVHSAAHERLYSDGGEVLPVEGARIEWMHSSFDKTKHQAFLGPISHLCLTCGYSLARLDLLL